ncbi:enoyl-CoA hydratase-related protein [Sutcliffiella cohnii]|uniref:Enoyl-CoA hydratase n=1 Tax=Sutcliffiella cohnii TaxID=33932 RepID=A0A223KM25_9BACI|nr:MULTISPECIES: enoyl-CoA hydratase-related protein [Sutcliffiella]AST90512.1 enoyl-CoA hydratase [Sutcliffiella cohnii]MED4016792.1 enoyl-CoA hydratase-related protein [Sutcliffiella cohnii]WBL16163.1 enoyl-CoA hydratase-related protein [Sutcliffiella sp. NC1]
MSYINVHIENYIATVTLNRPDAMNAFNYDMLVNLGEVAETLRSNPEVRVVIITAAGEKAYSVGADLKERRTLSEQQVRRNVYKIGEVFSSIANLPQPTIAAINGFAFGGGMELLLACDFRVAVKDAKMGLTETSLAIIPGAGGTQRLPRIVGESKALELILTARRFTAEEASNWGLITRLVNERAELLEEAKSLAEEFTRNGPLAVQQAKFAIKQGMNVDLQTGLQIERKAYEVIIPTEDRVEALQAFQEKRPPVFKGK